MRNGFLPPEPPLLRLPKQWELWEELLDHGVKNAFSCADEMHMPELHLIEEQWRTRVAKMPLLEMDSLTASLPLLQKAHQVLARLMHLYVHSQPIASSKSSVKIPEAIAVPLLQISAKLEIPPVITYSDIVLYNWSLIDPLKPISIDNVQTYAMFGTAPHDEKHFYLVTVQVELKGAEALAIIQRSQALYTENPTNIIGALTSQLDRLSAVLGELVDIFKSVRNGCDPNAFYDYIRPWFRGSELKTDGSLFWEFELGGGRDFDLLKFQDNMAGATAGQSSLFNALDLFLGIESETHSIGGGIVGRLSFLDRMKAYMPLHHRKYLERLADSSSSFNIRKFVEEAGCEKLVAAYDRALTGLKEFRSQHVRIVTLYIISPSRRRHKLEGENGNVPEVSGTGGSDVLPSLKAIRDAGSML